MIRLVFFGSPEFAVPSLVALDDDPGIDVVLAVTQPDRRAGRGRKIVAPPVKVVAEERGISVVQPASLRDENVLSTLLHCQADLFVVVSYGAILRERVLEMPRNGCLNVHPSLLPCYRGATPIPAAILNGDRETGVTIMRMVRRLDAGPVLAQRSVSLDGSETTGSLTAELAVMAAGLLLETAKRWNAGDITERPQDDTQATYSRELTKSDAEIDWSMTAVDIERFVRAMDPWPRAWSVLGKQRVSLHRVAVANGEFEQAVPGEITYQNQRVLVATSTGTVELLEVQPAGKNVIAADAWYRGLHRLDSLRFDSRSQPAPPLVERK